jgi:hypothetical protein
MHTPFLFDVKVKSICEHEFYFKKCFLLPFDCSFQWPYPCVCTSPNTCNIDQKLTLLRLEFGLVYIVFTC